MVVIAAWIALVVVIALATRDTEACDPAAAPGCPPTASASDPLAAGASQSPGLPTGTLAPSATPEPTPGPTPLVYTFEDEFDGPDLRPEWGRHWPGFGATDWASERVTVEDGLLVIRARRVGDRFVSGLIDTVGTFEQRYGTFTARVRFEGGAGLWPAFWLAQPQNEAREMAEIDVLEVCANPPGGHEGRDITLLHSYVHHPDGSTAYATRHRTTGLADAWHEYSVEWRPDAIVFSLDGVEYARFTEAADIPDMPMAVVVDLAGGGDYCGPPDETTPDVATMEVDWIRVTE